MGTSSLSGLGKGEETTLATLREGLQEGYYSSEFLGRHATVEDFEKLGIRRVTTLLSSAKSDGNLNTDSDRYRTESQALLNRAFDGIVRFSIATKIPVDALSLGGNISITFVEKTNPKFETLHSNIVIPLEYTHHNESFIGMFAHEWFHALDYLLSRGKDFNKETDTPNSFDYTSWFKESSAREEVKKKYNALINTIRSSDYYQKLKNADSYSRRKGIVEGEYFASNEESIARAFEGYFYTMLSDNTKPYNTDEASEDVLPDLYSKDTAKIFKAFDNLFNTLKVGANESTGIKTLYSLPALEGLTKARSFVTTPAGKRIVLKIFDAMWTKRPELVTNKIDQSPAKGQHERNTEVIPNGIFSKR